VVWNRIFGRADGSRRPKPRLSPGIRIYAIGDVHGRADLLKRVLAKIDVDAREHPDRRCLTILLGDYVDRGPDSRGVIDLLVARSRTHEVIPLMGNHEAMMLRFLQNSSLWEAWAPLGGVQTLLSYGLRPPARGTPDEAAKLAETFAKALPASHAAFLGRLPYSFENGDVLFVHAGIRPGVPLKRQELNDLIWIRDDFLNFKGSFGKLVVHGHTPVEEPEVLPNRINIDTGAYATGKLSCIALQDETVAFL
jgi:serine/threonine protein phosphatase 1